MLDPIYEEKVIGHAEVRQLFKASGVGTIAGSYVLDGVLQRGCKVRISREGEQIFEGPLASLKRFKDDVKEVKAGYKRTHWMWYIFPQIAGLGFSRTSQFYSISDLGEAKAYLQHEVLGAHTKELCESLLALETNDAVEVFDWPDDMKLKSCMTLFEIADTEQKLYGDVLDKFFDGK